MPNTKRRSGGTSPGGYWGLSSKESKITGCPKLVEMHIGEQPMQEVCNEAVFALVHLSFFGISATMLRSIRRWEVRRLRTKSPIIIAKLDSRLRQSPPESCRPVRLGKGTRSSSLNMFCEFSGLSLLGFSSNLPTAVIRCLACVPGPLDDLASARLVRTTNRGKAFVGPGKDVESHP
jgi:hypothetical protein